MASETKVWPTGNNNLVWKVKELIRKVSQSWNEDLVKEHFLRKMQGVYLLHQYFTRSNKTMCTALTKKKVSTQLRLVTSKLLKTPLLVRVTQVCRLELTLTRGEPYG